MEMDAGNGSLFGGFGGGDLFNDFLNNPSQEHYDQSHGEVNLFNDPFEAGPGLIYDP